MTLGQKIKRFRVEKGISQLDLELEIETSYGRISKIENGKINPDKETIVKISKALQLDDTEVAYLFGFQTDTSAKIIKTLNKIDELENAEKMMVTAVTELSKHLDYLTVAIFLLEGEIIRAKYYSKNTLTDKAIYLSGYKFQNMACSTKTKNGDKNLLLKSALEGKVYESDSLIPFGIGVVNKKTLLIMQKLLGFKRGLALPLNTRGINIGSMFFVKQNKTSYDLEIDLLKSVSRQIAIALYNSSINQT